MSVDPRKILSIRDQKHILRTNNARYQSNVFVDLPRDEWPKSVDTQPNIIRVVRSREFLVQIYGGEVTRLSICRAEINSDGSWRDGITWDELQNIKNKCGFADFDAVEVYPKQGDVVNVANLRHLWVLPDAQLLPFVWRRGQRKDVSVEE